MAYAARESVRNWRIRNPLIHAAWNDITRYQK
jgi:hypothetical protein